MLQVKINMEVINVFEIDKKKFGLFVSKLRKENGFTQKELAERLFISDKAVSKWETGVSLPDTALIVPLADLLGISVTELLMCEKMTLNNTLEANKVEDIVKVAITYTDENPERAYQVKSKWSIFYVLSFLTGCIGTFMNHVMGQSRLEILKTIMLLCAVFGAYFCFFVKTKLPTFYDENEVNIFYDGAFRMHMPGMKFNNSNWPHIVKIVRICMCLLMIIFPIINLILGIVILDTIENYLFLIVFLCVFFIPVYIVGKKYE